MLASDDVLAGYKGMPVAITGATGFVGSWLARRLIAAGAKVSALYPEPTSGRLAPIKDRCHHEALDLLDRDASISAIRACRPEIVFHLAAYGVQPRERTIERAIAINVVGASTVIDGAATAGARKVVQIGTSHEYGESDRPIAENHALAPAGQYGATKAAGMLVGRARAKEQNIHWLGLRPFVTYGPTEDTSKLIPYIISTALRREPVMTSAATQVRDLTYVEDLVEGIALCALADIAPGETLNLGSGVGIALKTAFSVLEKLLPLADFQIGARPLRDDDIGVQIADVCKQRRLVAGWAPKTPLRVGLEKTVSWYKEQNESELGS